EGVWRPADRRRPPHPGPAPPLLPTRPAPRRGREPQRFAGAAVSTSTTLFCPDIIRGAHKVQQQGTGGSGQTEEGRVQPGGLDLLLGRMRIEPERGLPRGVSGALLDG